MIAYAKLALTALEATGLLTKILIGLGAFGLLVTAYGVWHHEVYRSGVNDTLAKIARADAKTIERATKLRSVLKECEALGKNWNQSTGRCS